jgi:hypothetical protein
MAEKAVKEAPKTSSSKVFDIAKPGKGTTSATARPVIVTNRPIMQDPMVAATAPNLIDTKEPLPSPAATKITIQPLSETEKPEDIDIKKKDEKPATPDPVATEAVAEVASKDEPVTDAPTDEAKSEENNNDTESSETNESADDDATEGSDGTVSDTPAELSGKDAKEAAALEAAAKQQEEIDKITESRDYFLPINTVERRRTKVMTVLGVILIALLGLLLINLLMDVGYLNINGIEPVTHFFSS